MCKESDRLFFMCTKLVKVEKSVVCYEGFKKIDNCFLFPYFMSPSGIVDSILCEMYTRDDFGHL